MYNVSIVTTEKELPKILQDFAGRAVTVAYVGESEQSPVVQARRPGRPRKTADDGPAPDDSARAMTAAEAEAGHPFLHKDRSAA